MKARRRMANEARTGVSRLSYEPFYGLRDESIDIRFSSLNILYSLFRINHILAACGLLGLRPPGPPVNPSDSDEGVNNSKHAQCSGCVAAKDAGVSSPDLANLQTKKLFCVFYNDLQCLHRHIARWLASSICSMSQSRSKK